MSPFGAAGRPGRTLGAVRLTLIDVAEDSVTELIFDVDDTDRARGGGLRAGHDSSTSASAGSAGGYVWVAGRPRGVCFGCAAGGFVGVWVGARSVLGFMPGARSVPWPRNGSIEGR